MTGTDGKLIMINQLPLPALLVRMIEDGRWDKKPDAAATRRMAVFTNPGEVRFLGLKYMESETRSLASLYDYNADAAPGRRGRDAYGLTRSEAGHPVDDRPGLLDVRLAVCLSVNFDEEGFCLDYRPGIQMPRVVAGITPGGAAIHWQIVAGDFATFVEMLGM